MEYNGKKVGLRMVIEDEEAGDRNGKGYDIMMEVAGLESLPDGPGPESIGARKDED